MDLKTRIRHPTMDGFAGGEDLAKEREPGIEIIERTP